MRNDCSPHKYLGFGDLVFPFLAEKRKSVRQAANKVRDTQEKNDASRRKLKNNLIAKRNRNDAKFTSDRKYSVCVEHIHMTLM